MSITRTCRYQLPIFCCTIMHPWRYACPYLGAQYIDDVMSYKTRSQYNSGSLVKDKDSRVLMLVNLAPREFVKG